MNRDSFFIKQIAIFLALVLLNQVCFPTVALALAGGPSQPEVQGFEPVGTSNMVDLFTGDFSYNIPLLDVDGYPINLAYSSNPGMDDDASWVGLGWSLNPGSINRNLRGFPDDFKGDEIQKETSIKPDITVGTTASLGVEVFGLNLKKGKPKQGDDSFGVGLSLSAGWYHNTYKGYGREFSISPSLSLANKLSEKLIPDGNGQLATIIRKQLEKIDNINLSLTPSLSFDAKRELDINGVVGVGLGYKEGRENAKTKTLSGFSVGGGISSRRGAKDLTLSASMNNTKIEDRTTRWNMGTSISFGDYSYFPTSSIPFTNSSSTCEGTVGAAFTGVHAHLGLKNYRIEQFIADQDKIQSQSVFGTMYSQDASDTDLLDFNRDKEIPYREDMPIIPMSFGTYDLFSVTGQGVSGQFRFARNDIGMFRDGFSETRSDAENIGAEIGFGNSFHGGTNATFNNAISNQGKWSSNSDAITQVSLK